MLPLVSILLGFILSYKTIVYLKANKVKDIFLQSSIIHPYFVLISVVLFLHFLHTTVCKQRGD